MVVCGRNKRRSRTAESIFKNDARFNIRSAGLSPSSDRKLSENDLRWSQLVLVMEKQQRSRITHAYSYLDMPTIEVMDIPDEYDYMDAELVSILTEKIEEAYERLQNAQAKHPT